MPAKLSSGPRTGKGVFNTIPKKRNAKECSNYPTIALISNAIKAVLKIVQAKLQQYVNRELPDIQVGFRKGRESRDQIVNICCIIEKQENSRTSTSALLTTPKSLCGSQQTVENSERDGNTRPPYLPPEKSVCMSRSNS